MADDRIPTPSSNDRGDESAGPLAGLTSVSTQLEHIADTLSALGQSLHGVAATLKAQTPVERQFVARAEFGANDLLSIVSHDLLTPLTAVAGNAALIRQHAPDGDRSLYAWADEILQSANAMEQLIRDLDTATFDPPPRTDAHDVASIVAHAIEIFQPIAAQASIALSGEVGGPLRATCDPPKIFEVLAHLVENAIMFTRPGGSIRVGAIRRDGECVVSVSDTGVGIAKNDLASIFDAKDAAGGCGRRGVGLYMVRWIVEAHGGRIAATSDVGVGSTFVFTLPIVDR
jgi:signal transduction histidine kinase